jgi:hypothetical protein
MSAVREPLDGREAAFLRMFNRLSPRQRQAVLDVAYRFVDGQSIEDDLTETAIDYLGDSPDVARRKVKRALLEARRDPDWWRRELF